MAYKEIEVDGQILGLHLSVYAIAETQTKVKELKEQGFPEGMINGASIAYALYFSYLSNCITNQIHPGVKYSVFSKYVDRTLKSNKADELNALIAELYKGDELANVVDIDVKKKKQIGAK